MRRINVAVLITVYNRKDVTLLGVRSFKLSISKMPSSYRFDIYMVDDGSTDGTADAVAREFSDIKIVKGNGTLFWGGGMRTAWKVAIESSINYSYYIWYNDDSILFPDALEILLGDMSNNSIITGAFCDDDGKVSYGGKDENNVLITPDGKLQPVYYMNGNLVLIPIDVVDNIGLIDKRLIHSGGDFEYGLRAKKNGYNVFLTTRYVGKANRHDEDIPKCYSSKYKLCQRLNFLKSPLYNPKAHFYFNTIAYGYYKACYNYLICYLGVFFPALYSFFKTKREKAI